MVPDEAGRLRDLLGDVWCRTCEHSHIPDIPTVTFRCASDCGFGVWGLALAVTHATEYPEHNVYALRHDIAPEERTRKCPNPGCDQLAVDSGEGRFCGECQDYEGTCWDDHCLTCGAPT
jgi:hypothetical protein